MKNGIVSLIVFLSAVVQCAGWGPTGHRVTGLIAEKHLTKKARAALQKIFNGQSLPMASTWMDEIRSDSAFDYMTDWHWVTIPAGQTYAETTRNPNGDLIQTLERVISELKSKKLGQAEQLERLRILVHLVGDLHQPLHVGNRDDRGGNSVKVMWFGSQSNLHRVWDSDMIDDTKLSYTELTDFLDRPGAQEIRQWKKASIHDWAKESQSYHAQLYDIGDGRLGYRYSYVNLPVVRHRLLQAGIRIAGLLNEIYG